jgi:hypothetical protein
LVGVVQGSTAAFTTIPPHTASLGEALVRVPRLQVLTDKGRPVSGVTVNVTVLNVAADSLVSLCVPVPLR